MIDVSKYMLNLKGKEYLPVAPRIVMMRELHPDWSVQTEPVMFGDIPLMKATITDGLGDIVATAHKTVVSFRGGDIEKAETGAIGRALSIAGFGTLQAGDMDEGEQIADSPQPGSNGTADDPTPALDFTKADINTFTAYCVKSITRYDNIFAVKNALKVLGFDHWPVVGEGVAVQRQTMYTGLKKYASYRDAGMDKDAALKALADELMGES